VNVAVHESSVNFQSLIRDLAEMYPFEVDEVVVSELVANCLDAGATRISIEFDPNTGILVVEDNGKGMTPSEFAGYHDFAAELKIRGTGIGFAGVGAKVSFRIADRVITETRSKSFSAGSNWYLQDRRRLIWEEIKPRHLKGTGTRVEIHFGQRSPRSFESTDDLINLLRRHYLPLLDRNFLDLYDRLKIYSKELRFVVNGQIVTPFDLTCDFGLDEIKEFYPSRRRRRFGYGILGLSETEYPLVPDLCGVLVCTYGKVVKSDLFSQFPGKLGPRILGVVEVPALVQFLTTTKTDFIKHGRHKQFEELYDPLRQEFKDWLKSLGVEPPETSNISEAGKLEKELKKIVEDIPELGQFFGFRIQKTLFQQSAQGVPAADTSNGVSGDVPGDNVDETGVEIQQEGQQIGPGASGTCDREQNDGKGDSQRPRISLTVPDDQGSTRGTPISRPRRRGPKIAFVRAPDRPEMAWVEGNNVVINSGHPSYVKVRGNPQARMLHNLFAIANAIQRYLRAEGEHDLMFVDRMMRAWGCR